MSEHSSPGITIEARENSDWLRMATGKANAMGPRFLDQLDEALASLRPTEEGAPARPLIITGAGSAFSAGLDLAVLLELDRTEMNRFVSSFNRVLLSLACLPRPVIAAVNGHAIAGGAVMLLGCDYRIGATGLGQGTKTYWIGLKESQLGLPLPRVGELVVTHALPHQAARLEVALTGDLFGPAAAARLDILNRLVPPQALELEATRQAARFALSPAATVARLKAYFKRELHEALEGPFDNSAFLDAWFSAEAQRRMKDLVARLGRR